MVPMNRSGLLNYQMLRCDLGSTIPGKGLWQSENRK